MKNFKVLGSGCAKCSKTAQAISAVAEEKNIAVTVEKVSDAQVIMAFGVMRTPAVVVDEKLVHSGSVPPRGDIEKWLADV